MDRLRCSFEFPRDGGLRENYINLAVTQSNLIATLPSMAFLAGIQEPDL
jgi:hypothetical protein